MMHSTEGSYLKDDVMTGFLKPYAKGYSFAALLSKEGMDIQDSYIEAGERRTTAGAATAVELARGAIMADKVELNRPFVYTVVDNQTKLPLFLGTVLSI